MEHDKNLIELNECRFNETNYVKKPLFFLFTCVRNGRGFIDKLFDSLLNQTKINFIHYIYEDGSSDPLDEKIEIYREKASKLPHPYRVYYEKNLINIGLNKATQHCISKCSCPFFIWIDCDNYVDANFFKELEKLYRHNKNAVVLRSILLDSSSSNIKFFNCGTLKEAQSKYQLGMFIRRKFYYSFFAVNFNQYCKINPDNVILNERRFYNDEQILLLCLLNNFRTSLSKKAFGYFLDRSNQESAHCDVELDDLKDLQIKLCSLTSKELENKLRGIYQIKDLYKQLDTPSNNGIKNIRKIAKQIKLISKRYKIPLRNFYKSNLCRYKVKAFIRRIKNGRTTY